MTSEFNPKQLQGTSANRDLLRLRDVIAPHGPLPVSRSTWFAWVAAGEAPQPVKLGRRITAYRRSEVEAFLTDPANWRSTS